MQQKPALPGTQQTNQAGQQQQPGQQQGQQQQPGQGQVMNVQNKQNRITPLTKPAGLDPVILLTERENRLVQIQVAVIFLHDAIVVFCMCQYM